METNLENGVVETPVTPTAPVVEQPKAEGKQSSFDADAFFESLSKRADDFFTNNASKQLEKKFGMNEEEIKTLISEHKAKQGNDLQTLVKENENLKNEIRNIKKNEVINSVVKELDIKSDKVNFLLKLADLSNVFNEQGEADASLIKASLESVLKDLPEFKNQKEPEFGKYSEQEKNTSKNTDMFNFNFPKVH